MSRIHTTKKYKQSLSGNSYGIDNNTIFVGGSSADEKKSWLANLTDKVKKFNVLNLNLKGNSSSTMTEEQRKESEANKQRKHGTIKDGMFWDTSFKEDRMGRFTYGRWVPVSEQPVKESSTKSDDKYTNFLGTQVGSLKELGNKELRKIVITPNTVEIFKDYGVNVGDTLHISDIGFSHQNSFYIERAPITSIDPVGLKKIPTKETDPKLVTVDIPKFTNIESKVDAKFHHRKFKEEDGKYYAYNPVKDKNVNTNKKGLKGDGWYSITRNTWDHSIKDAAWNSNTNQYEAWWHQGGLEDGHIKNETILDFVQNENPSDIIKMKQGGRIHTTKKYQQPLYPTDMEGVEINLNTNKIPKFSYTKENEEKVETSTSIDEIAEFVNSPEFQNFTKQQENFNKEFGRLNLNINTDDWTEDVDDGSTVTQPSQTHTAGISAASVIENKQEAPKITDTKPDQLSDEEFYQRYLAYIDDEIPNEVIPPVSFISNDDKFSCMSCHAFTGINNTRKPNQDELARMNMLGFNYTKYKNEGWDKKIPALAAIPAAIFVAPVAGPVVTNTAAAQSVKSGVGHVMTSMNASRFGVPGMSITNLLNSGFISHGIMSLPETVKSWGQIDMYDPDSWAKALDNTFWNTVDFLGLPHMLKESQVAPKVMNEILKVKKWAKEKFIGKMKTYPDGSLDEFGHMRVGEHKEWKMGILPELEIKLKRIVDNFFPKAAKDWQRSTQSGYVMEHNSGITNIVHSKGDYQMLMETYKPNYITTSTGQKVNMSMMDDGGAAMYVDKLLLDHLRFPKETKNLITNSNRIIREAGGLKNMSMDDLAKDPDALLGLFLKNRKVDFNSLQAGFHNKGIATVEVGGKKYMLIRRDGGTLRQGINEVKDTQKLAAGAPDNIAVTSHVVEVKQVGTYLKGEKFKAPVNVEGWIDEASQLSHLEPKLYNQKGQRFNIFDHQPNRNMYIDVQPLMDGKSIINMTIDDLAKFRPENIQNFLSSISKAKQAGIKIDYINPNNFLFNPTTGNINIVDIGAAKTTKNNSVYYTQEVRSVISTMYKSMLDDLAKNKNIFSEMETNRILQGAKEKPFLINTALEDMRVILESNPEKAQILKHFNTLTKTLKKAIHNELKVLGVTPLLIPTIMGENSNKNNGNEE